MGDKLKGLFVSLVFLVFVACAKPPEPELIRGEEVTWTAEYKGWACGDFAPQLMPVEGMTAGLDLSEVTLGLEFYVPLGLTAPDQVDEVRVPGNRFLIRGHFYFREHDSRKFVVPRFDLLGWKPLALFRRWQEGEAVEVEEPLAPYSQPTDSNAGEVGPFAVAGKYEGC